MNSCDFSDKRIILAIDNPAFERSGRPPITDNFSNNLAKYPHAEIHRHLPTAKD
jgi:hypothetical protein